MPQDKPNNSDSLYEVEPKEYLLPSLAHEEALVCGLVSCLRHEKDTFDGINVSMEYYFALHNSVIFGVPLFPDELNEISNNYPNLLEQGAPDSESEGNQGYKLNLGEVATMGPGLFERIAEDGKLSKRGIDSLFVRVKTIASDQFTPPSKGF